MDPQPTVDTNWFASATRRGVDASEALAVFDRLQAVSIEELPGRWTGRGIHTGHPLDGMLEAFEWHGKRFDGIDAAFPLLFRDGLREPVAIEPRFLPLRLAARLRLQHRRWAPPLFHLAKRLIATQRPSARLRMTTYRGVQSATMVYDALPVLDIFRRVDRDRLMGAMDWRYCAQPLCFMLERE